NLDDDFLNEFRLRFRPFIQKVGTKLRIRCNDNGLAAMRKVLPKLFGDERHKWMQQPKRALEHIQQRRLGALGMQLDHFQVPVAELMPEKQVHMAGTFGKVLLIE